MPTNLHHIAVIGHDAGGKRRDWCGLRNPGNGHQDQTCNRHRRESPYHCVSPYAFACGIDIRFDLRLLRNALDREKVSADHGSGQCAGLVGERTTTDTGETSHERKGRNDPARSFGDAG